MFYVVVANVVQVTLVRMSNDKSLPVEKRRNYGNVFNAGDHRSTLVLLCSIFTDIRCSYYERRGLWRFLPWLHAVCEPRHHCRRMSG